MPTKFGRHICTADSEWITQAPCALTTSTALYYVYCATGPCACISPQNHTAEIQIVGQSLHLLLISTNMNPINSCSCGQTLNSAWVECTAESAEYILGTTYTLSFTQGASLLHLIACSSVLQPQSPPRPDQVGNTAPALQQAEPN